ncbi:hypothetical protein J7S71_00125 [Enterobacter hormaechei]|uniref:DUF6056 family protein n=1 Tax=Enterobacter hormaechei TaxID=158836 RepID=UPI001B359A92|nr:DUF6056 family protein [Enterobacter hormaechei]MBQ0463845.1 hypothetical protein [Enterobacter hormaechei]MCM7650469.1 DUF6056 family protein [Enterobacter hormaechei]
MLVNNRNSLNSISFLTIAICLIYVFSSVVFKDITDDHFFSTALSKYSIFEILKIRYDTWSGRILIEAFLMKTINVHLFPQIAISLSCILLAFSVSKMASIDGRVTIPFIALSMLLFLSDFHTNRQATLWITGAYNYIIPISIGLYAVTIYLDMDQSIFKKLSSCVLIFLASNNEQFAVTAIIATAVIMIVKFKAKGLTAYDAAFTVSLLCGGAIVLAAPGNVVRLHSEIINWMPDFENYGVLYKLSVGVDRISNQVNFEDNFLFIACCFASLSYLLLREEQSIAVKSMALVFTLKIVTFLLLFYPSTHISELLRSDNYIKPSSWGHASVYLNYLINLVSLSSILITCLMASGSKKEATKISVILVCGVLSALMIGFSPTAYASGTRVMFLFDISIAVATVFMIRNIFSRPPAIGCGSRPNSL